MTALKREDVRADFTIDQPIATYTEQDHETWRTLFHRQAEILKGRACDEYLDGLSGLGVAADGIPDFRNLSEVLTKATGWSVVAVPGLVPDDVFFDHLANRRFPPPGGSGSPSRWIISKSPTSSTIFMAMCPC